MIIRIRNQPVLALLHKGVSKSSVPNVAWDLLGFICVPVCLVLQFSLFSYTLILNRN